MTEKAQAVLDAIKAFEAEHGDDPQFAKAFTALADVERHLSAPPQEESPGRKAVRDAAEQAKPKEQGDAKPPDEGKAAPKSLKDAREAAKARLDAQDSAEGAGEAAPAAAAA